MGGRRQARNGERAAGQAAGDSRRVRASTQRIAGRLRRGDARVACAKKIAVPAGRGRQMIETIRQGLKADGIQVSISKMCQWFAVPRRTVYYRAVKGLSLIHISEPTRLLSI